MSDTTHMQTEVTEETYDAFRRLAHERGLSIRAALQEATEAWVERERQVDPDDPLFALVADAAGAAGESLPDTARTNASDEDDLIDGWSGDASDIELADLD